jgi:acyl-CoA thioesterase
MGTREEQVAEAAGAAMVARDRAAQALGMRLDEIRPGYARVRMTVRADMLNGHGTCHGGIVFSLADSAFAFACNSRGVLTVAAGCSIEFLMPAREGDELVAEATERTLQGRQGVYDVDVAGPAGVLVATFRGRSAAPREPASSPGS